MWFYLYNGHMQEAVLVVGINGFVGKHLARELHAHGFKVHGTGLDTTVSGEITDITTNYTQCDLTKSEEVKTIPLDDISIVINLAALAVPSQSFKQEELYYKVNVTAHTNLLDRLQEIDKFIRVLAVSSGGVYDSNQPMPLTEESALAESGSPYVLSKQMLETRLADYRDLGFDIIIARPFNHTGPGQGPGLIVPDLAHRIMTEDELVVGPLNTSRDYTHVKDVVRAYRLLISHEGSLKYPVYNICSGKPTSRDQLIELITKALGRPTLPRRVDPSIGRPNDPMVIYGNHARLTAETGWKPEKTLEDIINDYVTWLKANSSTS